MADPMKHNPDPIRSKQTSDAGETRRLCAWDSQPIRDEARVDARYCSQRCRQAAHRFHRGAVRRVANGHPMRFAYADPPYPGMARRYYQDHPHYAGEVDHIRLVEQLDDGFPDGWALSTSAAALRDVLASCPTSVRVAAWFRGERPTRSYRPLVAWEPVIVSGGRPYLSEVDERRVDALVYSSRARTTDPARVVGAKPAAFCWWLFELLGAQPGDEVVDLFPGSGGVTRAWAHLSSLDRADALTSSGSEGDRSCQYSTDASPPGCHDLSLLDPADASPADPHDLSCRTSP